jgi:hypothetical protein
MQMLMPPKHAPEAQWRFNFSGELAARTRSIRSAMDSYTPGSVEEGLGRRIFMPAAPYAGNFASLKTARKKLSICKWAFHQTSYADLFDQYQPKLVVASTPGWRMDRYLLWKRDAV